MLLILPATFARAQLSLYSAVDLARRNSPSVRIAQADVAHASAALSETRDVYLPSLTAGSSAGYSYGFPVGQPTIASIQAQSLVVSFSQPDYIRSARAALHTAALSLRDALDQVELDSALDYLQLSSITQQLSALDEQKTYAERLDQIEQERVSAGVESRIAATRAELTAAQSDLKRLDLLSQAALLRKRLSDLTGLPTDVIQPEPATVPGAPRIPTHPLGEQTAGVQAGFSNAASKHYLAHGDNRQNFRPQIGFGFNYQLFDTSINNYNEYYRVPLQANNFSVGVQVSFPLFNAVTAAHARGTAADAVHADTQAEQNRMLVDEQQVQLAASLPTLSAQARVAELQAKLADEQLEAVLVQLKSQPTSPATVPPTPADEMESRINERARFSDAVEARFTLLKAQLSLLRVTGGLGDWIDRGAR